MDGIRIGIVAQPEDPELRRHRERVLAAHPGLRGVQRVLVVVVVAAVVVYLLVQLRG